MAPALTTPTITIPVKVVWVAITEPDVLAGCKVAAIWVDCSPATGIRLDSCWSQWVAT
jgi:hypothetical protein